MAIADLSIPVEVFAQSEEQYMDRMLNRVDQSNWQNVPVKQAPRMQNQAYGTPANTYQQRPLLNYSAQQPQTAWAQNNQSMPQMQPAMNPQAGAMQQPQNIFTPQNLLRVFLGGSPSGGTGNQSSNRPMHLGDIQSNLQRARDQCQQAENDAERANQGKDKGLRLSAASSAQYHANDARGAAERAESMAYSGTQQEKDYAQQARNAANRAQSAADRARYNAECGSY